MKTKTIILSFVALSLMSCNNKKTSLFGTYSRQISSDGKMSIELKSDSTAILTESSTESGKILSAQNFIWHVEGNTFTMYDRKSGKKDESPYTFNGKSLIVGEVEFTKE